MSVANAPRQWALATAGVLSRLNGKDITFLGGEPPGPDAKARSLEVLSRDWDASTRESLLKTLDWLAAEGHRKELNAIYAQPHGDESSKRVRFARKHRARIGNKSLLAWDAGRLVSVAGWGALAGLVSEDEAWSYIVPMAQAVQRTYASWDELGTHYLVGLEFWSGKWDGAVARAYLGARDDAQSPWRSLPWTLDLSAHGVPAPLKPIVLEGPPAPALPPAPVPVPVPKTNKALVFGLAGAGVLVVGGVGLCFSLGVFSKGAPPMDPVPALPPATASAPSATPPKGEPAPHEPAPHASSHPGAPPHGAPSASAPHAPPAASTHPGAPPKKSGH